MFRQIKYILIFCVTCFVIILFSQDVVVKSSKKEKIDQIYDVIKDIDKAPDFSFLALDDSIYTLSKMKDQVVLINFWATWCGPCRLEIPEFNDLFNEYNDSGFSILGISISDNKKQLQNFTKSFKMDYPVLYGKTKEMNEVMKQYGGVYAVPSSFLIGREGNIIWKYPGAILKDYDPQTYANLKYKIEKALIRQN